MPSQNGTKSTQRSASLKELGSTGLNYSAGQVNEDFLVELQGENAVKVYDQMVNDPIVGGILFAIDMLIRQVEWTVEPNTNGKEADVVFLQECMDDMSMSWPDLISEILSFLPHGWAFFEILYKARNGIQPEGGKIPTSKYTDGKIGWRKFAMRAQSSKTKWIFSDSGAVDGMVQRAAPKYEEVTIPINKALLFRTSSAKGNPEGRSALRSAYRPWFFKKRMEEIEGIGIERDLAGLPFIRVDAEILLSSDSQSQALVQSLRNIIQNVRQDKEAGVIFPMMRDQNGNDLVEFTLMNSGGSRTFDITNIIQRYDERIAMTVLADFIMLGHAATGSYALSSDKTNLFATALGAWLSGIEDVINRFAVTRLWRVNGMDETTAPKIVHKDIEKPNLAELAQFMSTLGQMGMPLFPDEDLEKHLRELADLPEQSEEAKEKADEGQMDELQQLLGQMQGGGGDEEEPEEEAPEEEQAEEQG